MIKKLVLNLKYCLNYSKVKTILTKDKNVEVFISFYYTILLGKKADFVLFYINTILLFQAAKM